MSQKKILIAEDDPIMLALIEKQLKMQEYEVMALTNGRDALLNLESFKPDMVITDLMMPLTSGIELISIIRHKWGSHYPIIVLSAIDEEDTVMEAFNLGADDFLTKPVKPGELGLRVKRLLPKV